MVSDTYMDMVSDRNEDRVSDRKAAPRSTSGVGGPIPLMRIHAEKKCMTLFCVSRDSTRRARLVVMWYLL